MKNKKKGFTLVELIVVLAILAILAAMLVPALTGYIDKANEKKAIAAARQYAIAAQSVVSDSYADNKSITEIVAANKEVSSIKVGDTAQELNSVTYDDDFKKLAELKDGDKCTFKFDAGSHQMTYGSVESSGKTVTYNPTTGNWS